MFRVLNASLQLLRPSVIEGATTVRHVQTSAVLFAEPLKKKKRIDPQILRMREERKKRKLEKGIRQLLRHAKKLKPIDEMEVSPALQKEIGMRTRPRVEISPEVKRMREALTRAWSSLKATERRLETEAMQEMLKAQTKALEELRLENETLYEKALEPDMSILPFKMKPLVETSPIKGYEPPDGKYTDVSKRWRP